MAANAIVIRFGTPTLIMDASSSNPEKFIGDPVNVNYVIEGGTSKTDETHNGSGRMFITQLRMIVVKSEADVLFSSFTIPYRSMLQLKLKKPMFGSSYMTGSCNPLPNSGWTKECKFVLKFKNSTVTKQVFDSCNTQMERSLSDASLDHDSIAKLRSLPAHVCLPGKFRSPTSLKKGGGRGMSAMSSSSAAGSRALKKSGSRAMVLIGPSRPPKSNPRMGIKRSVSAYSGKDMIIGQSSVKKGALTETFKAREAPIFAEDARVASGPAVASAEVDFSKLKKKRGIHDDESKDRHRGMMSSSSSGRGHRSTASTSSPAASPHQYAGAGALAAPKFVGAHARSISAGNLPDAYIDPASPDDIIIAAGDGVEGTAEPDHAEIEVDAPLGLPPSSGVAMGIALSEDASDSESGSV